MLNFRKGVAAVVGVVVMVGLLAGCSSTPTQTKSVACTKLLAAVEKSTTELNAAIGAYSTDPTTSAKAVTKVSAGFHDDIDAVTNGDVAKTAATADTAIAKLSSAISASAKTPDAPDTARLTKASTAVSAAFVDVRRLCSA